MWRSLTAFDGLYIPVMDQVNGVRSIVLGIVSARFCLNLKKHEYIDLIGGSVWLLYMTY
jgi:hypothetical protein